MFEPEVLPADVQAVLDVVDELAGDHVQQTPADRAGRLVGLRRVIDRCEAEFLATLAAFDAGGDGDLLHGARTTTSWCKGALHLSGADASSRVHLARQLHTDLKPGIDLLATGTISYDQIKIIGRTLRPLPTEAVPAATTLLTELATHTDADTLTQLAHTIRHRLDPDGTLTTADKNFSRRHLSLSPLLDGMVALTGLLDTEAATTITTALQPFLVPAGSHDHRTTTQRRADGLTALAHLALDQALLGELGGNKPRLEIHCPLPTLTHLATTTESAKTTGAGIAGIAEIAGLAETGVPPAQWLNTPSSGAPLTTPDLARISCDATIARIIWGPASIPIDYGRDHRLFTATQRKALATRDQGCRFPGCHFPPALTDAHHIQPWLTGGPTTLHNGTLLCRHHHRHIHHNGWTITPTTPAGANNDLLFTGPNHQQLTSKPPPQPPTTKRLNPPPRDPPPPVGNTKRV